MNLLFLAAFLLINLVVGLRASRGVKTMDEYAVANRGMREWVVVDAGGNIG